jgi:hypothetical protein
MTLARRIMTELQTYADIEVSLLDIEQAREEFHARVQEQATNRKRVRVTVAAVAAVLVLAVIGIAQWWPRTGDQPAPPADNSDTLPAKDGAYFLDLATKETTPVGENLVPKKFLSKGGDLPPPLYSPDGTRIAFTVYVDTCRNGRCSPHTKLVVENADGSSATAAPSPDPHLLAWSPDGTQLLYQGKGAGDGCDSCSIGNLHLLDLESGATTQLTDFELSNAWWWQLHADFSPDGSTVIFDLPRSTEYDTRFDLWSVPVDGGEPSLVLRNAVLPRYLPDGEHFVFLQPERGFTGDVISIASPGGGREALVDTTGTWFLAMSPERTQLLYPTDGATHLVDIATGQDTPFQTSYWDAAWVSEDTLIVVP